MQLVLWVLSVSPPYPSSFSLYRILTGLFGTELLRHLVLSRGVILIASCSLFFMIPGTMFAIWQRKCLVYGEYLERAKHLARLLGDGNGYVRKSAAKALGEIADPASRTALEVALHHETKEEVRKALLIAVRALQGSKNSR